MKFHFKINVVGEIVEASGLLLCCAGTEKGLKIDSFEANLDMFKCIFYRVYYWLVIFKQICLFT